MINENQLLKGHIILHSKKRDNRYAKLNSNVGIRHAACIATAIVALMLTACSDGNGMKSFKSSGEAISEYHGFLTNLQKDDKVSIKSLAEAINEWRMLNDSVTSCLTRDTASYSHTHPFVIYREIKDSIRIELCRMAMSKQRSYHDLFYLKEQTSPYADDEELHQTVKEAQTFFASLDSLPVYNKGGRQAVMKRYQQFLQKSVKRGIHSKEDLCAFIKKEHIHFKAFLYYLPDFADSNIAGITRKTEQCCVQILRAADRKELSHMEAMIYIAMRTNLRLIRNAQVAIQDLRSGRVKSEDAMHAYLLMMVQPFMSMDDMSIAVLSETDKDDLYTVADALPKEMDNLTRQLHLDKKRMADMPMLMMKIYITRL